MNATEYEALVNVLMELDPWPLDIAWHTILVDYANKEAISHGYTDWIDALHNIGPSADMERFDNSQFGVGG